jgi:hypothetical protein
VIHSSQDLKHALAIQSRKAVQVPQGFHLKKNKLISIHGKVVLLLNKKNEAGEK